MLESTIIASHDEVPELEVPEHVLVRVDLLGEERVLVAEQERCGEQIRCELHRLVHHDEVLQVVERISAEHVPIRTVVQIVVPDEEVDRQAECVQTSRAFLRGLQRANIDCIPRFVPVTVECDVRRVLLDGKLAEPIDVVEAVLQVLIAV